MLGDSKSDIETAIGWYVDAGAHSITLYNFVHIYAHDLWDLIKDAWDMVWELRDRDTVF